MANEAANRLRIELEQLELGAHLCCIYSNKEEQLATIIPYIAIGLEKQEKLVYIVDERSKEEIIQALEEAGIEIKNSIRSGQFLLLTKEDAYLKDGYFDPDKMINLLKQNQEQALKEGYSGFRVTGEMTWIFTKAPGVERIIEYEAKLNYFFPESKSMAICQYHEERFSPEVLLDIIHTHPKIVLKGAVCNNPYYIPPDEFIARMQGKIGHGLYERIRDDIITRGRLEADRQYAAEEALRLSSFPELNPNPVVEVDFSGQVNFSNSVCRALFPELRTAGLSHPFLLGIEAVINTFREGEKSSYNRDVKIGDRWFMQSIYYVPEIKHLRIYGMDITDRKIAEYELKRKSEELESFNRIMFDREERIIELKEEIKKLEG